MVVGFNPDYLLISGDTSMMNSTRQAGAFPLACLVLIPAGVYRLFKGGPVERLILIGLVTSPLAVLTGTLDLNRYRGLFVLPLAPWRRHTAAGDGHRPAPRGRSSRCCW